MKSFNRFDSVQSVTALLGSVRKRGIRLWSTNGQLYYRAPKGGISAEDIDRLRECKQQLVALLDGVTGPRCDEPKGAPGPRPHRAPLTFSQLAHWHLYQLGARRAIRQIVSATRLRGRLHLHALRQSVAYLVCRHEALRTRIIVCDEVPEQEIADTASFDLEVYDVPELPESVHTDEVSRRIDELILEPIDPAVGPLFEAQLLRVHDHEHVLIVVMDHIISDAFSMGLLLRDLFRTYVQVVKGRPLNPPPIPVQLADYAIWQRNQLPSWMETHRGYWSARLNEWRRVSFPSSHSLPLARGSGWGSAPIRIGKERKAELSEWSRLRQTTVVMSVLTAYVGTVLCWCDSAKAVILYQTDGRTSISIENTIGCFTSALYLYVELLENDSMLDLLNRLTGEYCRARENADSSYFEAQVPRPEFTRNTCFNWVPNGPTIDLSDLDESEDAMTCSAVTVEHPMLKNLERDTEPFTVLFESEDEIVGSVYFPLSRFSATAIQGFTSNFMAFIHTLLKRPADALRHIAPFHDLGRSLSVPPR